MFFRRDVRGPDRWLKVKVAIFTAGAVLAVIGMATEIDWVIWAAVVVLAAGVVLRFLSDRNS